MSIEQREIYVLDQTAVTAVMLAGVVGALALALVVGMSVDYIIHLAHAYKNSLFDDRYLKSRAALFARGQSIASAGVTTIGAVLPLLLAQLLPLREFGKVFALVAAVSLVFAVACVLVLGISMRSLQAHVLCSMWCSSA